MSQGEDSTVRRAAWLAAAIVGSALGYLLWKPMVDASAIRYEDAQARLQSERVAFATRPELERERTRLRRRFGAVADGHAAGNLLRRLAIVTRRHGIRLISTDLAPPGDERRKSGDTGALQSIAARIELEGTYRSLLSAIDELGRISDLVRIEPPSLRATGRALGASVQIVLLQPEVAR